MVEIRQPLSQGGVVTARLTEHDGDAEVELVVPGADGMHCTTRWPAERLEAVIDVLAALRAQLKPLPVIVREVRSVRRISTMIG